LPPEYTRAEPPKKPQGVNKSQFEAKPTPGQTGITRAEIRNPNSELRKKAILALPGRATGRTQTRAADNGRNCHLRKEVQLRGVFRFSEIIAIIVSCGRRSVEMGRSNE